MVFCMEMRHNPFINCIVATNTGTGKGGKPEDDVSNNGNHLGGRRIKNHGISKRQEALGS
jgi:hypothetical protein